MTIKLIVNYNKENNIGQVRKFSVPLSSLPRGHGTHMSLSVVPLQLLSGIRQGGLGEYRFWALRGYVDWWGLGGRVFFG